MPPIRLRAIEFEVDAIEYDGTNGAEVVGWVGKDAEFVEGELILTTGDGRHVVDPGQTVLFDPEGKPYMLRPAVRAARYRLVGEG